MFTLGPGLGPPRSMLTWNA